MALNKSCNFEMSCRIRQSGNAKDQGGDFYLITIKSCKFPRT